MRRLVVIAFGLAVVVGAWLLAAFAGPASDPEVSKGAPVAPPGTWAEYAVNGTFQNLEGPIVSGRGAVRDPQGALVIGPYRFAEGSIIRVQVSSMVLPDNVTRPVNATVIAVHAEGALLVAGAADARRVPFLYAMPQWHPADVQPDGSSLDPLDQVRYRAWTGPLDLFLVAGLGERPRPEPPGQAPPWYVRSREMPEYWTEQTDGSDIVVHVDRGDVRARFEFRPGCSLPASISYAGADEGGFAARLLNCGKTAFPAPRPPTWDPVSLGTTDYFTRFFPGEGANLPLPHGPAVATFLGSPASQRFLEGHPEWIIACATVRAVNRPPGENLVFEPWTWGFTLIQGTDQHVGWVTATLPSPLGRSWIEDPGPQTAPPCYQTSGAEDTMRFMPVASVDALASIAQFYLPPRNHEGHASIEQMRFGHDHWPAAWLTLSRCSVLKKSICSEIAPHVELSPAGPAVDILAPRQFHVGPLQSLLGLAPSAES